MSDVLNAEEVASVLHDHRAMPAVRDLARSHERLRAFRDESERQLQSWIDRVVAAERERDAAKQHAFEVTRYANRMVAKADKWELAYLDAVGTLRALDEDAHVVGEGGVHPGSCPGCRAFLALTHSTEATVEVELKGSLDEPSKDAEAAVRAGGNAAAVDALRLIADGKWATRNAEADVRAFAREALATLEPEQTV